MVCDFGSQIEKSHLLFPEEARQNATNACHLCSTHFQPICPEFESRTRRDVWIDCMNLLVLSSASRRFLLSDPPLLSHQKPTFEFN